jgi:hypothetical protein
MLVQVSPQLQRPHVLLGTSGSHAVAMDAAAAGLVQRELFHKSFSESERQEIIAALKALVLHYSIKPDTNETYSFRPWAPASSNGSWKNENPRNVPPGPGPRRADFASVPRPGVARLRLS